MFQTRPRLCGLCLSAHSPETSRSRLMAQHVCVHVHVRSVCRPADRTVTTAATATTSTMLGRPGRSRDAAAAPATNRTRTRVNQRAHTCHALASTSPGGRHRAAAAAASEPTPPAAAAQQPTKHQLRSGVSAMHSQWPQHSRQHSSIINGMRVLRNVDTHTHTHYIKIDDADQPRKMRCGERRRRRRRRVCLQIVSDKRVVCRVRNADSEQCSACAVVRCSLPVVQTAAHPRGQARRESEPVAAVCTALHRQAEGVRRMRALRVRHGLVLGDRCVMMGGCACGCACVCLPDHMWVISGWGERASICGTLEFTFTPPRTIHHFGRAGSAVCERRGVRHEARSLMYGCVLGGRLMKVDDAGGFAVIMLGPHNNNVC